MFKVDDWVAWKNPASVSASVRENLKTLVGKYGFGPFLVLRERKDEFGQSLTLRCGSDRLQSSAGWFQLGTKPAETIHPEGTRVIYITVWGDTQKNGMHATVVEHHTPALDGVSTAHGIQFDNGSTIWAHINDLTVVPAA